MLGTETAAMRRSGKHLKRTTRIGVSALVLLATSTGVAFATGAASIPGADGSISGCYNTVNGQLRAVTSHADCRTGEAALTWSVRGPEGARGPQGERGEAGTARGFVHIGANGALDGARTKGVAGLYHKAGSNLFCFDLEFDPLNVVASPEGFFAGLSPTVLSASVDVPTTGMFACPGAYSDAAVYIGLERPFYAIFN